jgi:hypothetical protein
MVNSVDFVFGIPDVTHLLFMDASKEAPEGQFLALIGYRKVSPLWRDQCDHLLGSLWERLLKNPC